jgi:hypothetical protein
MSFGKATRLLNRPVPAALRAEAPTTLTEDLVVVFEDLLPSMALAPVVIDVHGVLAIAQ